MPTDQQCVRGGECKILKGGYNISTPIAIVYPPSDIYRGVIILCYTGTAHSQDPDSDVEQYSEPTYITQPMEEEGEVSDWESTKPGLDLDQEVSEEQRGEIFHGVETFARV